MSNKLNVIESQITLDNFRDYLFDLGEDIEILAVSTQNVPEIIFKYHGNDKILYKLFITIREDILNRFLFMIPNGDKSDEYQRDISFALKQVVYLKSRWED